MSSQACGAYGPLYGKNADGNVDESYGNYYWDIKNVGTVSFTTGYRIYESASNIETPYNYAVGASTTYTLVDHGYVNPNPPIEERNYEP